MTVAPGMDIQPRRRIPLLSVHRINYNKNNNSNDDDDNKLNTITDSNRAISLHIGGLHSNAFRKCISNEKSVNLKNSSSNLILDIDGQPTLGLSKSTFNNSHLAAIFHDNPGRLVPECIILDFTGPRMMKVV